jgi:glycosyltransferase involved in cell wall biosynthesis
VAGIPYVQTIASFKSIELGLRLSRSWCRHLIATGADLAAEMIDDLGVPSDRIAVIPPGIIAPAEPLRSTETPSVPVVGTAGSLDDGSGVPIFLEAAQRVIAAGYDAEFVVASQGAGPAELRRRAQQLGIGERVTVADFASVGADIWTVVDLYCQPAKTATSGGALLQAMAHGIPCIATDVAGLRGLIEAGTNGLIVPRDDPKALKDAITALLDDPEGARCLGRNAHECVRRDFDPDLEADRLVALYRKAVRPQSGAAENVPGLTQR